MARRQSNPANAETVAMVLTFLLFEKSQYQNVRLRGLILRERAFLLDYKKAQPETVAMVLTFSLFQKNQYHNACLQGSLRN